jgi:hypothetical protein
MSLGNESGVLGSARAIVALAPNQRLNPIFISLSCGDPKTRGLTTMVAAKIVYAAP